MEIVIIGCGAAGGTAAQFARKNNRKSKITLFEKGPYPQYSRCGLPYTLSGEVDFDKLTEFSQDWFYKYRIDLHLNTPVKKIDFDTHSVHTARGEKKFDSLIIATGTQSHAPFPIHTENYSFLRTLDDAKKINDVATRGTHIAIIGGGPTGLEAAEALLKRGVKTTLIEYYPSLLPTMLDPEMASIIRDKIIKKETMSLSVNHEVISIDEDMGIHVTDRKTGDRNIIHADFILVASGSTPVLNLVPPSMIDKGIIIDEKCETSKKNVYAIGDCSQYQDNIGSPCLVGLGSIAVRQGKVAGINASGGTTLLPRLLNTRVTKVFNLEIAAVGPLSTGLENPLVGTFRGSSHPPYFPGEEVRVKVLATRDGKICAAQIIGPGAAHRINSFATAIGCNMTLQQFIGIETAYAPVVSPVFLPSTLACEVALRKQ
jgi:NADPH-dependent 2,4-dienoyl-CoA reductase/sulfur reductase-like enzyme